MAKKLRVEFKYFNRSTCSRCKATDKNVAKTVAALREALPGIEVDFRATKLPARRLAESNSILINGVDIEEIVNGRKKARETPCRGCGELLSGPCDCRAYTYRGRKYRQIPKAMILEAVRKSLNAL
jgi:hypothetical protein